MTDNEAMQAVDMKLACEEFEELQGLSRRRVMKIKHGNLMKAVLNRPGGIKAFAVSAGLAKETIYSVLNKGHCKPRTLEKICKVLGREPAEFHDCGYKGPRDKVAIDSAAVEALLAGRGWSKHYLAMRAYLPADTVYFALRDGFIRRRDLEKIASTLGLKVETLMKEARQ